MTEQFIPTTQQVREAYKTAHVEVGASYDPAEFDRWLAKHDAEVAAKAWDEGRAAEKLAWEHAFDGHPVPEGEVCDECAVENPYRKAVKS